MTDMHIPPLRGAGIEAEEIEERRKELRDLGRELNMVEAQLMTLEARRAQAARLDAEAGARARRAGKKVPPAKHTKELEDTIEATQRERDILEVSIETVKGDISSYVSDNAERLINELSVKEAELNRAQLSALSALEEARSRRVPLAQAASWIASFLPPEEEAGSIPAADRFEVIDPHAHARSRPSDLEIARVFSYLKREAGAEAEVVMEAQDFSVVVDGRASQAHSFDRRIAAFQAEREAAGGSPVVSIPVAPSPTVSVPPGDDVA